MKMVKRNYLILLVLALVFVSPGIIAYLYYLHPQWLSATTTNKGTLLRPPVLFTALKDTKPKWRLILWTSNDCEEDCLHQLEKLARIRLALGRRLYEIDQWLVLRETAQQIPATLSNTLHEQDIHVLRLTQSQHDNLPILQAKNEVFIANPEGYLILAYPMDANSEDIYRDIKQLLKKSS